MKQIRILFFLLFTLNFSLFAEECKMNSSARSCLSSDAWGGAIDLSILVWQAREDGLAFAIKSRGVLDELSFAWEPAFKLNFEMACPNSWDFDARWTCYHGRTEQVTYGSPALLPLWILPQDASNVYNKARSLWQLHLNTIDLELGADAILSPYLSMRVHGGLKTVLIHQSYALRYFIPSKTDLKTSCLGVGPRIGFDSDWRLGRGISFAANVAGTLALSHFETNRKDFDPTLQSTFHEAFYAFRPMLEMLLGLDWDTCAGCQNQYAFGVQIAYEVQYFYEENVMSQLVAAPISFLAFSPRGDLHCHGLTATFRFGF
jgi:hypothetical protein